MTNAEKLLLDEDGIPILTDIVRDIEAMEAAENLRSASRLAMPPDEIAAEMLGREAFRKHLEEVAGTLTRTVCRQMEVALQPVLEQAISRTLNDRDAISHEEIHRQLESSLPGLIADALQAPADRAG